MKKLTIIALVGLVASLAFILPKNASNEGVQFTSSSLSETIAQAKEENKKVFLDISTSWCGYCKKMKANTYTAQEVGVFMNKNYINITIDAEKGEGPEIARKYGVKAYPTQVILDNNGNLIAKNVGYLKPNALIKFVQ